MTQKPLEHVIKFLYLGHIITDNVKYEVEVNRIPPENSRVTILLWPVIPINYWRSSHRIDCSAKDAFQFSLFTFF